MQGFLTYLCRPNEGVVLVLPRHAQYVFHTVVELREAKEFTVQVVNGRLMHAVERARLA